MIGSVCLVASFDNIVKRANKDEKVLNTKLWEWDTDLGEVVEVKNTRRIVQGKGYFVEAYRSAEITISAIAAAPSLQQEQRETQLLTNFPNPFNPETWIPFELEKASEVIITIYTTAGQVVRVLPSVISDQDTTPPKQLPPTGMAGMNKVTRLPQVSTSIPYKQKTSHKQRRWYC